VPPPVVVVGAVIVNGEVPLASCSALWKALVDAVDVEVVVVAAGAVEVGGTGDSSDCSCATRSMAETMLTPW
jgi:hypothetical protein